jgi:hypothetical protein
MQHIVTKFLTYEYVKPAEIVQRRDRVWGDLPEENSNVQIA